MPMMHTRLHDGYIFLVTVLVIGVIASATAASLMLLGWAAEQNGLLLVQSGQALEYAQTCIERSIRELRSDLGYVGDTSVTFEHGLCEVERIGGTGNENRYLCVVGYSGDSVHRIQIHIRSLFPTPTIRSWEEVSTFTLCN